MRGTREVRHHQDGDECLHEREADVVVLDAQEGGVRAEEALEHRDGAPVLDDAEVGPADAVEVAPPVADRRRDPRMIGAVEMLEERDETVAEGEAPPEPAPAPAREADPSSPTMKSMSSSSTAFITPMTGPSRLILPG